MPEELTVTIVGQFELNTRCMPVRSFGRRASRALQGMRMPNTSSTAPSGVPAGTLDAPHVLNGFYTVLDPYDYTHRFQVYHTRHSQSVLHKRVIKRYIEEEGAYKAFGFIDTNGKLLLWRRFTQDADEYYVQAAWSLLEALDGYSTGQLLRHAMFLNEEIHVPQQGLHTYASSIYGEHEVNPLWFVFTRTCYECNVRLLVDQVPRGFCLDHSNDYNNSLPEEALLEEEADALLEEARNGGVPRRNPLGPRRRTISAEPQRVERTAELPMCEVTGDHVQ